MNALIEARGVSREFVVGQRLFAAKPVIRAVRYCGEGMRSTSS